MRLTEEGNLGIGSAEPKAKLDVAGSVRAREGFVFNDGSTLNVNDKGVLTRTSADGTNTVATTSQNRIAKFSDNAGTVTDSLLNENGNLIELRATSGSGVNPTITNPNNVPGFAQFQFYPATGPNTNMSFAAIPRGTGVSGNRAQIALFGTDLIADSTNYEFAALRARGTDFVFGTGRSGNGLNRPFMLSAGFLSDNTTNNGQLFLATNGNVGVGTNNPQSLFDVAGNINTSTQYNIGGARVLSIAGTANLFAGNRAGIANTTGGANSFFGAFAGQTNADGSQNSFFSEGAGSANASGVNNSFFGFHAGVANTTNNNSFFGEGAGSAQTSGAGNSFFGFRAGNTNIDGSSNTTVGSDADVGSSSLSFATAIGAGTVVSTSNTIALGRSNGSDNVTVPGKVGIGITTPVSHLHVFGAGDQEIAIESSDTGGRQWTLQTAKGTSNGRFEIIDRTAGASRFAIDLNGNVGLGNTSPGAKLDIAVNSGHLLLGDAGCNTGLTGIGFGATMTGCTNYSLLGDGSQTFINAPLPGTEQGVGISLRLGNSTVMSVRQVGLGTGCNPCGELFIPRDNFLSLGAVESVGSIPVCFDNDSPGHFIIKGCGSSIRLKTNINSFNSGLSLLNVCVRSPSIGREAANMTLALSLKTLTLSSRFLLLAMTKAKPRA